MKILFVGAYVPYPLDSGGRIRSFHLLQHLAARHDVHLLALEHDDAGRRDLRPLLERCCSVRTVPASYRAGGPQARLARALCDPEDVVMQRTSLALETVFEDRLAAEAWDLVILDDLGTPRYLRQAGAVPVLWSKHNCEWTLLRRIAALKRDNPLAWVAAWCEGLAVRRYEARVAALVNRTIVPTQCDRDALRSLAPGAAVDVVANGVDTVYFGPVEGSIPGRVVFTGALFWHPNVDAVTWFVTQLWPSIRREVTDAQLEIVGSAPSAAVQALGRVPGVEVAPDVPDVRPHLARAAVCVAPLRTGAGSRLKILEALASSRAVVSTTVGMEGLDLTDGRDLLVANDAVEFAAACVGLLRDPARCAALGQAGRRTVEERFDWRQVLAPLSEICAAVVEGKAATR